MKKILVLDTHRGCFFVRQFRGQDIIVTENVFDFEDALLKTSTVFDIVFLAHDLGASSVCKALNVPRVQYSGVDAALLIKAMPSHRRPSQVIVHTHNEAGARLMYEALSGYVGVCSIIPYNGDARRGVKGL